MAKDEQYILDICDELLGEKSERQKTFQWLRGCESLKTGKTRPLPVDAYYPSKSLVIEYHETQHKISVKHWNKTAPCGCKRDVQRKRYDDRRREVLPKHGIKLVVIDWDSFDTNKKGRLKRTDKDKDREVVRGLLQGANLGA